MIAEIVSNFFGAAKEFFGWKREASARQNTPEMTANAKSAQDTKTVDEARKTIAKGEVTDVREKLS